MELFDDYSLEITTKDIGELPGASKILPEGTPVSVTFLPTETMEERVAAAGDLRRLGQVPVPHIAARHVKSASELALFLGRLERVAAIDRLFVIAGDAKAASGPYPDALSLLESDEIAESHVRAIGVAAYPDGHPNIPADQLWASLHAKNKLLAGRQCAMEIVTQFGFDAEVVLSWLERLRMEGIDAPVRIGMAGPAKVQTLLRYAARCGVAASASAISKYGISMAKLLGATGPDAMIRALVDRIDPHRHGTVKLHFYPFGGVVRTAEWAAGFGNATAGASLAAVGRK